MGKKIAIVGAGNLGQAMASHLALQGHQVSIYNRSPERIDEIRQRGGILAEGLVEGLAKLETASPDISEVIPGRDLVVVTVPASSHRKVAVLCAPHLEDGQAVALHPGHTFGAIDFFNALVQEGVEKDLTFAEIQTSLLTSRLTGPAQVNVSALKNALPIAVFPAEHGFERVKVLFEEYPSCIKAPNVLKTSLDNLNAPVHIPVTMLNLGRIDRGDDFLYYWEGFTPAVSKLVEAVDAERCELARALGVTPITVHEFFSKAYTTTGEELWQKVQSNEAYREISAPKSTNTRLIFEDLPTGLVPFSSLGQELSIPTPACDSLIEIASAIFDDDFRKDGRTLENLGMRGLGAEGIRKFVQTGAR
jgi:opine dehydrogenase